MPLEKCTNLFDDIAHHELDNAVLKAAAEDLFELDPDASDLNFLDQVTLLYTIIEHSRGKLDKKYLVFKETKRLINTHGELRDMLVSAWKSKSFREIRNLAILQPTSSVDVLSDSLRESALTGRVQRELLSALTRPYRGVAVDDLYEYLEQNALNFRDAPCGGYYAQFCSVVQSSGTGKTRTILELARKGVLLLYMNLRPSIDTSGFPLRDRVPASILTQEGGSEALYRIQCCAFFASIFKLVRDDLSARLPSDGKATVENWSNDMCRLTSSYRADFFKRLERTYYEVRKDILLKMGFDDAVGAIRALSLRDAGNMSARPYYLDGIAEKEMEGYYARMTDLFSSVFPGVEENKPKLVIALDEAHTLQELTGFCRSTVLFSVIKAYSGLSSSEHHAVWVVLASTTSKVDHFASSHALLSGGDEFLFPPFSKMGWDQYAPALGTVPSSEVAKAKHILQYGRPLWVSLVDAFTLNQIFDLATQKLSGVPPYNGRVSHQAFSVLAQRFGLDIRFGHREAAGYVESSVASHLRVCITTTENRLWSYTTYPSEPFLSCAAAFSLHETPYSLGETLNTLQSKVDNGMIDIGKREELVSRLLWLLAKDLFVLRNKKHGAHFAHGDGFEAELIHCQMIPVIPFFEFLFGDGFWSPSLAGPVAKAAFEDAYVNFSHWVSMDANIRRGGTDMTPPDQLGLDEWTLWHWQRTSAVQCCHDQPSIDKVIPIYFKSADCGNNGWDCMSRILISDNARVDRESDALHETRRDDPSIGGADPSSNPLPYIAILADLGLDKVGLDSVTFPTSSSPQGNETACLRIRAYGLGPKTYPFLRDYPVVLNALQYLVRKQTMPDSERLAQFMRDQVLYGSSAGVRHMNWERWSTATVDSVLR